jgi:hypothetical protein
MSNDQFADAIPQTNDAAIVAFADMAWCLYSDMKEHRLVGTNSIGPSDRREVLRWILFLDSDFEYRWPRMALPGLQPLRRVRPALTRWLHWPNAISAKRAAEFLGSGDYDAWPFISRSEYKHALRNPKRLAGMPRSGLSPVQSLFRQQPQPPLRQIDGEEEAAPSNEVASIVGHAVATLAW